MTAESVTLTTAAAQKALPSVDTIGFGLLEEAVQNVINDNRVLIADTFVLPDQALRDVTAALRDPACTAGVA
jgi:hypothetical protein